VGTLAPWAGSRANNPPVVMASGHVKWFDNKKGFGFISNEAGADVFVHYSAIQGNGFKTLKEGELVQFELIQSDKGLKAQNVQRAAV
jgi:CspA family cold shock protein